ncbi:unnamed protein product [Ixodes hexagonus]
MVSRNTQTDPPVKSVEVQAVPLMTDASTQMKNCCHTTCLTDRDLHTDVEDSDSSGESSEEDCDYNDEDYDPFADRDISFEEPESLCTGSSIFLVGEEQLRKLFKVCQECLASCKVTIKCQGTVVEVFTQCPSAHQGYWINQDVIRQQPLFNLLVAAGILFAGCNPKSSLRILSSIDVKVICYRTFFNPQNRHLLPAIQRDQAALFDEAKTHPVRLAGDGRADSPGFSAKYGTYSLLDLDSGKTIHFELVQSNEVGGSNRMELAGLKRGLSFLESRGIAVELLLTDRHVQAKAFIKK